MASMIAVPRGPFTMGLRSVGNPDFNQYAPISEPLKAQGATLASMKRAAEKYKEDWDLGGGNWVSPVVRDADGKVIGHFSYNLRFWKGEVEIKIIGEKKPMAPRAACGHYVDPDGYSSCGCTDGAFYGRDDVSDADSGL